MKITCIGLGAVLTLSIASVSAQAATSVNPVSLKEATPLVQILQSTPQACVSDAFAQLLTQEGVDVMALPATDCTQLQNFEAENGLVFEGMGVSSFGERYQQASHSEGRIKKRRGPAGISRRCFIIQSRTGRLPFFCRVFGFGFKFDS
jgi:hypothetical protein